MRSPAKLPASSGRIALISLIDTDRQWFKAKLGPEASQIPRSISFCAHAISRAGYHGRADATKGERFAGNPLVTGAPHIRSYAGTPLKSPSGLRIGALCVVDSKPHRALSIVGKEKLTALADKTIEAFEKRARRRPPKL